MIVGKIRKSAAVVSMMSSEWQAKYDKDDASQDAEENKFRWDGKFVANPAVPGDWEVIGEEAEIAGFDPAKETNARRPVFSAITLHDDGKNSDPTWIWSGYRLMDLTNYQALKMEPKTVDGTEYLFIEGGGFSNRNKPDWKSAWLVLTPSNQ